MFLPYVKLKRRNPLAAAGLAIVNGDNERFRRFALCLRPNPTC